ncbi:MAG: DUF1343 domain-containing protein [Bacteroidales bacterium]
MKKLIILLVMCLFVNPLSSQVKTGIEVLRDNDFESLKGKRVGLITNPTGVDRHLRSTIDILAEAPDVELVALYGPEHGVRGDFPAGEHVKNEEDARTGVPMFSLYGSTRKPTFEMLTGLDVLIYDIQDIGSRSYTYISTLGLAMEAAAENGILFMVLDRPNPLGGQKFEGPLVEDDFISFVSQFPIPYVHGFTVGELAHFLNETGLLEGGIKADLDIVEMKGWERNMSFEDTGLPWVMSSPHIPHAHSAYFYPVSGILGELYIINIGVGYTLPFQVFGTEWLDDAELLAERLNKLDIPGVRFRPIHFRPFYTNMEGKNMHGVQVHMTDLQQTSLSIIQFYVVQEIYRMHPEHDIFDLAPERIEMFDKVCGTDKVRKAFGERFLVEDILDLWTKDIEGFLEEARPYFLY